MSQGNNYNNVLWQPSGRREIKAQKGGEVNELDTSKEEFLKIAELGALDYVGHR